MLSQAFENNATPDETNMQSEWLHSATSAITAAARSAPMSKPRSYCARDTATSMETETEKPAKHSVCIRVLPCRVAALLV